MSGWEVGEGSGGALRRIDGWAVWVVGGIALLMAVVLGQVVRLQVSPMVELRPYVEHRLATVRTAGRRGDLLDRRGRPLAVTRGGERLFVDPARFEATVENLEWVARVSGEPMGVVAERVVGRIALNERRAAEGRGLIRYVSIGDVLSDGQLALLGSRDVAGVHTEKRLVRERVADDGHVALAALVGKTGVDHEGIAGVERALDDRLRGEAGLLRSIVAANGRSLFVEEGQWAAAEPGEDVRLSIDLRVQQILMEELARAAGVCVAAGARGVVVVPVTGEILAMGDVTREV